MVLEVSLRWENFLNFSLLFFGIFGLDIGEYHSHDASIYTEVAQTSNLLTGGIGLFAGLAKKRIGTEKGGTLETAFICQDRSIYEQCQAGARFYDIRLTNTDGTLRGYHTALDTRGAVALGGLGASAEIIFEDINRFLAENPSEFVILRISHTHANTGVVDKVKKVFGHRLYNSMIGIDKNLAKVPIFFFSGKVICIFDIFDTKNKKPQQQFNSLIRPEEGIHAFAKYENVNNIYPQIEGLVTFGEYSNKRHIENVVERNTVKEGVKEGQIRRIEAYKKQPKGGHLFQIYWTQSEVADIRRETLCPGGAHTSMQPILFTQILNLLSIENQPSIILYDFVNDETSKIICEYNNRLGAFK